MKKDSPGFAAAKYRHHIINPADGEEYEVLPFGV